MALAHGFLLPLAVTSLGLLACGGAQAAGTGAPPPGADGPRTVSPHELELRRVRGERYIVPDDRELEEIWRRGRRAEGRVKLCVDEAGVPSTVRVVWSSGFSDYDYKLASLIRQWRFRPFVVDGKPISVCTTVTFNWRRCGNRLCP